MTNQTPVLGTIVMFAGNYIPRDWALCNGQMLRIDQNQALFSLLGTRFGGDGKTNFALPSMQALAPVHVGKYWDNDYRLGDRAGSETSMLDEIPSHNHAVKANANFSGHKRPTNKFLGLSDNPIYAANNDNGVYMNDAAVTSYGAATNQQGVSVMQPFLTLQFIICVKGDLPLHS